MQGDPSGHLDTVGVGMVVLAIQHGEMLPVQALDLAGLLQLLCPAAESVDLDRKSPNDERRVRHPRSIAARTGVARRDTA